MTPEEIAEGMGVLTEWLEYHISARDSDLLFEVNGESWTPREIVETLALRIEAEDLGHDDLLKRMLEAATNSMSVIEVEGAFNSCRGRVRRLMEVRWKLKQE